MLLTFLVSLHICLASEVCASTPPEKKENMCKSWRQTGGCRPDGKRESKGDKSCTTPVPSDASGYCECASGRVRPVSCGHEVFTCKDMCDNAEKFTCVAWRQTGDCSPDGPREEHNDQKCDVSIPPGSSGFCECGLGRIIRKTGCRTDIDQESFTCQNLCENEVTLYEILGLDEFASVGDIKKSFRKSSLKYHPDKIGTDAASKAKFNEIRHAHDTLIDGESRHLYDLGGRTALENKGKMEKAASKEAWLEVSLDSLYNGETLPRSLGRRIICKNCKRGSAASNSPRCNLCNQPCPNEIQIVNQNFGGMIFQQRAEVPSQERCRDVSTQVEIVIEKGMTEGTEIKFELMGDQRGNMLPGDVTLKLREMPHQLFRRQGNDLLMGLSISLKEALLGFRKPITHLDGREVWLENEGISSPNQVLRIVGEGMPKHQDPSDKGDLLCTLTVVMPMQLSSEHRTWLDEHL